MRFVWILVVVVAIGFTMKKLTTVKVAHRPDASVSSTDASRKHFNASDLEKLGCVVDPALGSATTIEVPLIGSIESYKLNSQEGCIVSVISLIQASKEYDDATWSGIRASANHQAQRGGYQIANYRGNLGEHSEIAVFSKNDSPYGFSYSVQSNGYIRQVIIYSEKIEPDEKFEAVFRNKIYASD
jgi:hypothetical protein